VAYSLAHTVSKQPVCLVADGGKECIAIGEVSVCGVGNDTDCARDLAEYDRVRPA
jgi:hypothetical protein